MSIRLRLASAARLALARLAPALACALLVACLGPRPAHAQGLSIAWQDCRPSPGTGFDNQIFGCTVSSIEFPLFPSFTLAATIDSVYSMELVIDVDVAGDPLPVWWLMGNGCGPANGWAADTTPSAGCADAWGGLGTGSFQGWLPGVPGGSTHHARLLVAASSLPQDAVKLDPATPYTACRILLRTVNTTACNDGCLTPACMVFNSLLLRRFHAPADEEIFLTGADVGGSDRVVWQGGAGADCQAVPTRRTTWGAVKALYR